MRCRTNLKKEKRQRNRVNAFRFKKGGFQKKRYNNGPDYAADQKKADEDNKFFSMVRRLPQLQRLSCFAAISHGAHHGTSVAQMFTLTAEEEAAKAAEAKAAPTRKA